MLQTLIVSGIVYLIYVLHTLTTKIDTLNERLNSIAKYLEKDFVNSDSKTANTTTLGTDSITTPFSPSQSTEQNKAAMANLAQPSQLMPMTAASPLTQTSVGIEDTLSIQVTEKKGEAALSEFNLNELLLLNKEINSQFSTDPPDVAPKAAQPMSETAHADSLIIEKDTTLNQKTIKELIRDTQEQFTFEGSDLSTVNNLSASVLTEPKKTTKNHLLYHAYQSLLNWFVQGNPVAKIGIILLFFGIGYFMKFSIERDLIPISIRFTLAVLLCVVIFGCGWYLRKKNELYALILEGGGIGGLYITVFASVTLYQFLSVPLAFLLMVLFCLICVGFAYRQSAKSLAILAALGGYAAPLLLSTGSNNYLILFSYYALISSGLFVTNIKKSWRELNLIGFIFTFIVGLVWGLKYYHHGIYVSSQLFLLFNLLLFGILSIVFASRNQIKQQGIVDASLVFGSATIGFIMQYYMTLHWAYGPAISALLFGIAYLTLAYTLSQTLPKLGKRIFLSYLIIGVSLTVLATPLAFNVNMTAIVWGVQAVAILWLGFEQDNKQMTFGSIVLLCVAVLLSICAYATGLNNNSFYAIFSILSVCYFFSAWLWFKESKHSIHFNYKFIKFDSTAVSHMLLYLGLIFWLCLLAEGSYRFVYQAFSSNIYALSSALALAILACTVLVFYLLAVRLKWVALLEKIALLWLAIIAVFFIQAITLEQHNPLGMGKLSLSWPFSIIIALFLLFRMQRQALFPANNIKLFHLSLFWIVVSIISLQLNHVFAEGYTQTTFYSVFLIFFDMVFLSIYVGLKIKKWPFTDKNFDTYWLIGLFPVILIMMSLLIITNTKDGLMNSGYYLPVFNLFELPAILALWILWTWLNTCLQKQYFEQKNSKTGIIIFIGLGIFWLLNGSILRTLSQFLDLPWQLGQLWGSRIVQMTFSLIWTMLSLILMNSANKNGNRSIWMIGAFLLAVVVVKLFFIDAAKTNGIERALTFIGVAILVLIIGYISPLPPKNKPINKNLKHDD